MHLLDHFCPMSTLVLTLTMCQVSAGRLSACVLLERDDGRCSFIVRQSKSNWIADMDAVHCHRRFLHDLLPEDVHERCSERTFVRSRLHDNL